MSTASKDSRTSEVFTEGSHHRNLAIDHNLYYAKIQSREKIDITLCCLIISCIDNKSDWLGRFIQKSQHLFLKKITSKLYGILLINFRLTTPQHLCLCVDVLNHINRKPHHICLIVHKTHLVIGRTKIQFVQHPTNP